MDLKKDSHGTEILPYSSGDGDSEEGVVKVDTDDAMKSFEKLIKDKDPTGTKEPNYILPYTLEELGLVFDDSDDGGGAIEHLEKDILVKSVSGIETVKDEIISVVRSEFVALHTDIKIDSLSSIFKIKEKLTYEKYIKLVKSIVKKSGLFYQIYAGTEEQKSQLRDTILIHFSKVFGIDGGAAGSAAASAAASAFEDVQIEIIMEHVDKYLKFMQKIIKLLTKYNTYTLIEEWDKLMGTRSEPAGSAAASEGSAAAAQQVKVQKTQIT